MTLDMVVALVVMVAIVVVLARELYAPAPTLLAGIVVLTILGVVPAEEAFAGFSSPATLTIAGLFVVARALQVHAGLGALLSRGLGRGDGDRAVLGRLVVPVLAASSVIANTPLVATLAPMVRTWSERHGRAPSTFLMPLSFAAILGGVITTIGTSTTLVVSGLVDQSGLGAFGFVEILPLGLPVALVGGALLVLLAPRVLPDRRSTFAQMASHERDYTFRLQVQAGGPLDGHTVADSGLRNLEQVYLAGLRRGELELTPLSPTTVLEAGDVLTFVGRVDQVLEVSSRPGLVHADETQATLLEGEGHRLVETVVGSNSPLANRTPKEMSFRGHYGAAIVAIHRQGERVDAKLGEVRLAAGDALLLMTDDDFEDRWRPSRDFAVVVPLETHDTTPSRYRPLVGLTTLAMVVAAAVGVPILTAVLAACLVLVGSRAIRFWDARGEPRPRRAADRRRRHRAGRGDHLLRAGREGRRRHRGRRLLRRHGPGPARRAGRHARADRAGHQRRRRRPDGPHRPGRGHAGRGGPARLGHRRGRDGLVVVPHPDRLPDQHDRLRPGRLPVLRLLAARPAPDLRGAGLGDGGHPRGVGVKLVAYRRRTTSGSYTVIQE